MPVLQLLRAGKLLLILNILGSGAAMALPLPEETSELFSDNVVQDLYLEAFINGEPTQMVAAVRKGVDGRIAMPADQIRGIGINVEGLVSAPDDYIYLDQLKNVTYRLDEVSQSIFLEADDHSRLARKIGKAKSKDEDLALTSSIGAVVNYSLLADLSGEKIITPQSYQGLSGSFDTRFFSPLGVVQSSFITTTSPSNIYAASRLNTNWSYSDPKHMLTYRAGDIVSGSLSWTRPVRLGGFQIQRNFNLRTNLVTMPVPELAGSAAVPSTVEVYANNMRQYSGEVNSGPFEVTDVPFTSGPGSVQIVVRDQFGRETTQEVPFYASSRMLSPGLLDFSFESGFARRDFGVKADDYDDRLMTSGSLRYGVARRLTVEAHAEGDANLVSGGAAALFNVSSFGIGTFNLAASYSDGQTGYRFGGSLEAAYNQWRFYASSQRTFGDYNDIASVTARVDPFQNSGLTKVPQAIDQLSISVPPFQDGSSLNLNFAHIKDMDGNRSSVLGVAYNRQFIGSSTLYVNGYADMSKSGSYGVFLGISMPLGTGSVSSGMESTDRGTRMVTDYVRPLGSDPWSMGWRLHGAEGQTNEKLASIAMQTPAGKLEATARQFESHKSASLQMSGAIAAAGGGIFVSDRINDAFAVVDAGAADIDVHYQNRLVGTTGRSGKILVPNLLSLQKSAIEIDPANLPVDIDVPVTRQTITPAEKSGVVVKFGVSPDIGMALLTLKRPDGTVVPVGAEGRLQDSQESFVVGYDGQTFIRGLKAKNSIEIELPDSGEICSATFAFQAVAGKQVALDNVVCQ